MHLICCFIWKESHHCLLLLIIFIIQVLLGPFCLNNQVDSNLFTTNKQAFLAANAFGPIPRDNAESLLANGECLIRRCGDLGQFDSFFITAKNKNGEFSHFKMKKMDNGHYSSPGDDQELVSFS